LNVSTVGSWESFATTSEPVEQDKGKEQAHDDGHNDLTYYIYEATQGTLALLGVLATLTV
tara:strand:- start:1064 stop:1243 length:180 start_codon:yes stop_codon:yes gene_type:complete